VKKQLNKKWHHPLFNTLFIIPFCKFLAVCVVILQIFCIFTTELLITKMKPSDFIHPEDAAAERQNESGTFFIDDEGVVQRFEPATHNPFFDDETEVKANYTFSTYKSIQSFVVPVGVKGFVSDFMRGVRVTGRFELPKDLESIGENCFANCILPSVVIPESVHEIGAFAFGHTHIERLKLPKSLNSPYGRQFKDSYIGTLLFPKEWKDGMSLGGYHDLQLEGWWFVDDKYGYLRWPSTYIKNLEFY